MARLKTNLFALASLLGLTILGAEKSAVRLPGPGAKFTVNGDFYGVYQFNQKPQMGMVILKIEIFNARGEKVAPLSIKGRSGMPSMPGAHDSGEVDFKLNSKSNYLLPVNIVMPGTWEIRLTFLKDGQPIFSGYLQFDV